MSVVSLKNVKKSYQGPDGSRLQILDIPTLEIGKGEQVVLLGESGGGKTTLLNVICGITHADAGEVVIDGINLVPLPEPARDRLRALKIGIVFQTFNLLPAFSALENVLLGMSFSGRGVDRKRAAGLLERVGLGHRLHQSPAKLSVGEQQRVAVARALANKPKVLLADEPTASVDPANQTKVLEMIRETCREENCALVLVTHSMEVAGEFERVEQLKSLNKVGGAA
ncbi:MAG: ABC transporter ATP-binding protein [Planctomycetaceae bacterium]|nr:ABC transporter ATP-binding protein [Planctomycetaceae bacterium]